MFKALTIFLALACSLGQSFCATATYYYEIENRRKPHHGWKFHLLGTIHTVPITYLPEPIQKHIKNHKFVITEKGCHLIGNNSKPSTLADLTVWEWLRAGNITYGNRYFSRHLNILQQRQLEKMVAYAYPELVNGGYNYEGRRLTLDDFNIRGLLDLYYSGGCRQGMDAFIEDLSKYGKSLDRICKTERMKATIAGQSYVRTLGEMLDDDRLHTPLNHPFIKHYFNGNDEGIAPSHELVDPITKDRNAKWLPHIVSEKNVYKKSYFIRSPSEDKEFHKRIVMPHLVAVGCAHLFGETGLLKLLQKQGYRIRRARVDGVFEPHLEAVNGQHILTTGQRRILVQAIRQYQGKIAMMRTKVELIRLALRADTMTPYDRMALDQIIEKMTNLRHKRLLVNALRGVADAYPVVKKKRRI